jgi:uncharacterized protein (UPF0303 family)
MQMTNVIIDRETRIAALNEQIIQQKERRFFDSMSNDYAYSDGTYARHTARINELQVELAELMKEN